MHRISENRPVRSGSTKTIYRTVFALVIVIAVVAYNENWAWGSLFIVWSGHGFWTGRAYLLEELTSKELPILCWCINTLWLGIGLMMIAESFDII